MFAASKTATPAGGGTDPQFNYVTLLLHGDGTNGAQNNTFLDSSTNNFTITRNGNTTQGSFSPYGPNWSNFFDGSGDFLTLSSDPLNFGTGAFTIEAWIYLTGTPSASIGNAIIGGSTDNSLRIFFGVSRTGAASGKLTVEQFGVGNIVTSTTTIVLNTWYHAAVSRNSSGNYRLFVNGVQESSSSNSNSIGTGGAYIGNASSGGSTANNPVQGYISNLRTVTGTALYTSSFTPSTTPLTAVSGTSLLTCQSNRFIDNSSNNFAITVSGTPSVQRFSPFAPSAAYDTATIGGSGYFDGSGDFLSIAANSAFTFGTGDFCIEAWAYANTATGTIFSIGSCFGVVIYPGAAMAVVNNSGFTIITDPNAFPLKQWVHVAYTRSSNTVRLFINGVLAASGTDSGNYTTSGTARIGLWLDGSSFGWNGYISNLRVVKGSAVYTAAFTPPTSPVTAITNTQLLCNMTNGAIFDNAMMNDLETVGNAQVSTSVKKYGTGSVYAPTSAYLINQDAQVRLGSGDFTIEFWVNSASDEGGYPGLVSVDSPLTGDFAGIAITKTGVFVTYNGSSWAIFAAGMGTVNDGTWRHIAVVRSGSSLLCFNNGVLQSTTSITSAVFYKGPAVIVGKKADNFTTGTAYIDDLRITKGYARYTTNFTPPIQAFPNQ